MSTLESVIVTSPYGKMEECAQFTVDNVSIPFVLHDIATVDQTYTLSFWIKSKTTSKVIVLNDDFQTTSEWTKYETTFSAYSEDLVFIFANLGTYWIYHPQLEFGNMATDWSPSPEDINDATQEAVDEVQADLEETKTMVNDAVLDIDSVKAIISTLVTGPDGGSLMTQTDDGGGWYFDISSVLENIDSVTNDVDGLNESLNNANDTIDILKQNVEDLGEYTEYIKFTTIDDQPAIVLGEADSSFKVQITNTMIQFLEGAAIPAYISNQSLYITRAVVTEELQQGGFIWQIQSNGSLSLLWKGV